MRSGLIEETVAARDSFDLFHQYGIPITVIPFSFASAIFCSSLFLNVAAGP